MTRFRQITDWRRRTKLAVEASNLALAAGNPDWKTLRLIALRAAGHAERMMRDQAR